MNRRIFLANLLAGIGMTYFADTDSKPTRILLRSSWQTVNIGDIAHTPGRLSSKTSLPSASNLRHKGVLGNA